MRKTVLVLVVIAFAASAAAVAFAAPQDTQAAQQAVAPAPPPAASPAPLSDRVVHYKMDVRLDVKTKIISGTETLTWRNAGDVPASDLRFHLYLNAFRNNRSTFMKESGGSHRGFEPGNDPWGWAEIGAIAVKDGPDLTTSLEFIHPDDDNADDRTVARVPLPAPVLPGDSITLEIAFRSKLPQVFARSGYKGDFFMAGQWFPKLGVWEKGAWNCHQYHASSEFYADFGVFEVDITVPAAYVVGATGRRVGERKNDDGTMTYSQVQEDVHDFAWTACPDFVEIHKPFTLADPPVRTEMIFLVHKTHLMLKDRYEQALRNGLEFYSKSYGPYPYATVTLVDPPFNAGGAGGMEYPTLFTTMGMRFFVSGLRMPEMVTIHEFGHGYWYGMVGSNEFEEAWLDEGINSYSEIKAMDHYYGAHRSMVDIGPVKIGDLEYGRTNIIGVSRLDPIITPSWEFYSGGSYGVNVYQKAAITLITLEGYLGEETMGRVMKHYFEKWKFRHPRSEDFFAAAEEASGRDLDWFFDQFFRSPDKLDYAVSVVRSREITEPKGIVGPVADEEAAVQADLAAEEKAEQAEISTEGKEDRPKDLAKEPATGAAAAAPAAAPAKMYDSEVVVIRNAELVFPQEVLVTFEDGTQVRETWDGKARWKRFEYKKPIKLKMAQIDPDNKIPLDVNMANNSRLAEPDKTPLRRHSLGVWLAFQKLLSLVAF